CTRGPTAGVDTWPGERYPGGGNPTGDVRDAFLCRVPPARGEGRLRERRAPFARAIALGKRADPSFSVGGAHIRDCAGYRGSERIVGPATRGRARFLHGRSDRVIRCGWAPGAS